MPKHEFFVDMTCEGCSNAVTRVLQKLGGVQFDIDLPNKKVCISSEHNVDTLLETLKKTGKNASYIGEKSAQGSISEEKTEVGGDGCPLTELKHDFSKKMA